MNGAMPQSPYPQVERLRGAQVAEVVHRDALVIDDEADAGARRPCEVERHGRLQQRVLEAREDDRLRLLACDYGGYGVPRILDLLRRRGWQVNRKRLERIWREEGLKVPKKQIKRRRLWLNDGSCLRLRPQYKDHVWSYDFIEDATHDGRKLRMLVVIDEFSRECLAIVVARRLQSKHVLECLSDLFAKRGTPA